MTRKIPSLLFRTLVLLFGVLLLSCDQQPPAKPVAKKEQKPSLGSPDSRFAAARSQMINGQFAEAAAALSQAADEPKVRPLLLDWIQLHQGIALMLAGKEAAARPVFAKIEERGPFPKGSNNPELADFMVKLAHLLRGADPVSPEVIANYDKYNYQGIAFLALALKDFSLEKYEDAEAFFRQFTDVAPEKQVDWADGPPELQKLKDMANNYVNDYQFFVPARKALDDAADKSIDEQREAVEVAQKGRAQMKMTTTLSKSLDETLGVMAPKVASVMADRARAIAEEIAADEKAMKEAKEKRNDLLSKFLFAEARAAISDPAFKTEKARDEQELLTKKTAWLANFKDQLIEDLNKSGYSQHVTKKSGDILPGAITKADQQQVFAGTADSPVAVPWADVSLDSAYEMGLSFIKSDMAPQILAFRQWHLGVFAFFAGKTKDALGLLQQGAIGRPVYKEDLPLFEKSDGPY